MKNQPLRDLEVEIGILLRVGVSLAATLVAIGGLLFLAHNAAAHFDYHVFRSEPPDLRGVEGVSRRAMAGSGRAIIQAGLIVLIATPVLRVALSAAVFARQRDWIYTAFTLAVLALLGYGLFG